ncbi:multidrug transporter [Pontibacter harenae]|uniref:multidrug transporter n=1 Tax=Pontibacter harenae TaxID=2894083 RepID=UPI001E6424F6|nr:multidrug transporter [Pontibacter harenae]MCC9169187.1 multidrug transporter [Pontibacter harenae]
MIEDVLLSKPQKISNREVSVTIKPKAVLKWLLSIMLILVALNTAGILLGEKFGEESFLARNLKGFFDLNEENNISAFFASIALLIAAAALYMVYLLQSAKYSSKKWHWLILSIAFAFLAIDENTEIHEKLGDRLTASFGSDLPDYLQYAWVIPYGVAFIAAVAYFLPFVFKLPNKTRNLFIVSGFLFVGGAIGFEMIESYVFMNLDTSHILYKILYTVEEALEMCGVILFIYATLDYLTANNKDLAIVRTDAPHRAKTGSN